jgi:predicted RNase H-like HicB family nuclease
VDALAPAATTRQDDRHEEKTLMPTTTVRTHTFLVRWSHEDEVWLVEHADRDDVFTYGETLSDARRYAVDALALMDDIDAAEVGPVRFLVDGPADRP